MYRKVGVVITTHGDTGNVTINNIENVIKYIPNSLICVYNNESKCPIIQNIPKKYPFIYYHFIPDQISNHGLTGTWNLGIKKCLDENCIVILLLNNDLVINDSIKYVLGQSILNFNQPFYYGVISDFPGHSSKYQRFRPINQYLVSKNKNPMKPDEWRSLKERKKNMILEDMYKRNVINKDQRVKINYGSGLKELHKNDIYVNGFCLILTKTILEKNKINETEYFSNHLPFSGNDREWFNRCLGNGCRAFIETNTWVKHYKYNSWKKCK